MGKSLVGSRASLAPWQKTTSTPQTIHVYSLPVFASFCREEIQSEEQTLLRRLREGVAAARARDAALAECEELKAHLGAQAEAMRAQKVQAQKMQARLHTVMQSREEEQSRDRQRIELQTLQMEAARCAAAAAKQECEELRSTLAAEQAEVTRLREVLAYQYNEHQKERHDAMRRASRLRAELKAAEARVAEERAEARAEVAVDSNHWQRECEKMCILLARAEVGTKSFLATPRIKSYACTRAPPVCFCNREDLPSPCVLPAGESRILRNADKMLGSRGAARRGRSRQRPGDSIPIQISARPCATSTRHTVIQMLERMLRSWRHKPCCHFSK